MMAADMSGINDFIDVVGLSNIGLTGIVTLAVLGVIFGVGIVPARLYNEVVRRNRILEDRIEVKNQIIQRQAETINELARELTPTVNQILRALPVPTLQQDDTERPEG